MTEYEKNMYDLAVVMSGSLQRIADSLEIIETLASEDGLVMNPDSWDVLAEEFEKRK
jgi:hypothetical protein